MTDVVVLKLSGAEEIEIVVPRAPIEDFGGHRSAAVQLMDGDTILPGIGGPVRECYTSPRFYSVAVRGGTVVRVAEVVASAFEVLEAAGGHDLKPYERHINRVVDADLPALYGKSR